MHGLALGEEEKTARWSDYRALKFSAEGISAVIYL